MRQSLTQKEWDELSDKEKDLFKDNIKDYRYVEKKKKNSIPVVQIFNRVIFSEELPSIGQIWEVLEDKIECIFSQSEKGTWVVDIKDRASLPKQFEDKEPIVALWSAYKYVQKI